MDKRIGLLFDCLKAPYDASHIIQLAQSLGCCDIYLSGNSIDFNNYKIRSKVSSWGIEEYPPVVRYSCFEEAVLNLHGKGKYLVGTSPNVSESFYDLDLSSGRNVLVFGTESSGLTKRKMDLVDRVVALPMSPKCKFLTLPVVVPAMAYEVYRQIRRSCDGDFRR